MIALAPWQENFSPLIRLVTSDKWEHVFGGEEREEGGGVSRILKMFEYVWLAHYIKYRPGFGHVFVLVLGFHGDLAWMGGSLDGRMGGWMDENEGIGQRSWRPGREEGLCIKGGWNEALGDCACGEPQVSTSGCGFMCKGLLKIHHHLFLLPISSLFSVRPWNGPRLRYTLAHEVCSQVVGEHDATFKGTVIDPGLNRMLCSSSSCLWGFIFGVHRVRLGDQIGSFMLTFRNVGVTCYIHFVVNIPKYWYKSEFHYLTRGDTRNLFECVFSLNHLLQWFDISSVWCNITVGVIVEVSIFLCICGFFEKLGLSH